MANSGARGTKSRNPKTEVDCRSIVPIICPIMFKYLAPVIYSVGLVQHCTPGDVASSGSSLVLPRAVVDTRGQYSTLRYTGASVVRYAMRRQQRGAQEGRREGRTRERGTGRKRSLGLLAAGGTWYSKAAGALVLGDKSMRRKGACYGGTDVMERPSLARGKDISTPAKQLGGRKLIQVN
jgi:hypothetical protein